MEDLFSLSMAQYTLILGMISQTDFKNLSKLNTLTCAFEWKGGTVERLQRIGNDLISRNDCFRLVPVYRFPWHWRQYIRSFQPEKFEVVPFYTEEEYESWLQNEKDRGIRLLKDQLYSIKVLRRASGDLTLWIQMHHFLTDGYSMKLLAKEIRMLNRCYEENLPVPPASSSPYREFVEKEKEYRQSKTFKEDQTYWREKLRMRRDFSFPGGKRSMKIDCDSKSILLRGDLYEGLTSLQKELQVSMPSLLESMAALLIYRIQGNTTFTFGTLNYGRMDGRSRQTMGCMMNSPPLLIEVNPEETFASFAKRNYEENLEMLRHIRFSTLDVTPLSYGLCLSHGLNFNFNWILFSYMDYEAVFQESYPKGRMFWSNTNVSQLYAAIFDMPKNREICFELRYQKKRFQEEEIKNLLVSYRYLIRDVLDHSGFLLKEFLEEKEGTSYDLGDAEKKSTVQ